jgi:outer membrane protein
MIIFSLLFALVDPARAERAYSLEECYLAATKRGEQVATQSELILQAEEKYHQAKGSLLPAINFVSTYTRQEAPDTGLGTSFSPPSQTLMKVTATQPLFRGFREYAAIRQKNLEVDVRKAFAGHVGALLFQDVAQRYYEVLSFERERKNLRDEIEANENRIKALAARVRIGRSRESEVLAVRATEATLRAQDEVLRGQLQAAREALTFITGFTQEVALAGEGDLTLKTWSLDLYLRRVGDRPDVKASEAAFLAAEEFLPIARGGHFPSLDLSGNYYLRRQGLLTGVSWDFALTGTIPVFAGGTVQSEVRQAASAIRQQELAAARTRRQAETEIRTFYGNVQSALLQVDRLSRAAELSMRAYERLVRDYELGLVSNLEVLQALASAHQTRRSLDRARYAIRLELVRLEVAAALRPAAEVTN